MFFKDTYFMKRANCLRDLKSIENLCIIPKIWFTLAERNLPAKMETEMLF